MQPLLAFGSSWLVKYISCVCCMEQVSALKCGLLPLCPETMAVDEVSYYEYVGAIMDAERRDKLRRALGPANKASPQFSSKHLRCN